MKPRFYSKQAIAGLSILSSFFGCILFSYNLREVGKQKFSPYVIAGSLVWTVLFKKLMEGLIDENLYQFLLGNMIASLFLTFFLWDKFFLDYPVYESKKVWKPLIVFLSICTALILLQIYVARSR